MWRVNKALIRVFASRSRDGNKPPPPPPRLLALPDELLLSITDFLDDSDLACLSLCNRALHRMFARNPRRSLFLHIAVPTEQRKSLLLRLARDQPKLFFCHDCSRLHHVTDVGPPCDEYLMFKHMRPLHCISRSAMTPFCFKCHSLPGLYSLKFQHVQLVMEQHRLGAGHGMALSLLSLLEVQLNVDYTTLFSVEPKILDDKLYVRIQQWIIFSGGRRPLSNNTWCINICSCLRSHLGPVFLADLLECTIDHSVEEATCPTCHAYLRCSRCSMDIRTEMKSLGPNSHGLLVTKWLCLGRGEDPNDPEWRIHWEDSSTLVQSTNCAGAFRAKALE